VAGGDKREKRRAYWLFSMGLMRARGMWAWPTSWPVSGALMQFRRGGMVSGRLDLGPVPHSARHFLQVFIAAGLCWWDLGGSIMRASSGSHCVFCVLVGGGP